MRDHRETLVAPGDERPSVAAWDHPLAEPNLEDARIDHRLAGLAKLPMMSGVERAYRQRFRLKRWQYMTAVTDRLFIAFVVGSAGYASNGFVYAVELDGPGGMTRVHKRFVIAPLTIGVELAPSSAAGHHRFDGRGLAIAITNRGRSFAAEIAATTEDGTRLRGELEFTSQPTDDHLALCVPLTGGRWNYTHKFASFAVTGSVALGETRCEFAPDRSLGTIDFTKMYAHRHSVWRWIALSGRSQRGAVIGLNMVDPTPAGAITENALWVDGRREPLAEVDLEMDDPSDARSRWRVQAGSVDLEMTAGAHVEQRLDMPLLRHRLRHVVGTFRGRVRTAAGQLHELNAVGIAEDWDSWW